MLSLTVEKFSLEHSLESGQCFYWKKEGTTYTIITQGEHIQLQQENNKLNFTFLNSKKSNQHQKEFVQHFFGLNQDFNTILKEITKDPIVKEAVNQYPGLRILQQDPWECTIGFICSSAANIPKIQRNIHLLAQTFGKKENNIYHFPKPGSLNNLKKIQQCGVGFRSKYLLAANKLLTKEKIQEIKMLPYEKAKEELMKIQGIGPKIADCILLFSFQRFEAFPVDVWIKRAMEELYLKKETKEEEIREYAQKTFGKYAGYAQQYLFQKQRLLKRS